QVSVRADAIRNLLDLVPGELARDAEQRGGALRERRRDRREVIRQRAERVERVGADVLKPRARLGVVALGELPRLRLVEALVDTVGDAHRLAHHLAELARLVRLLDQRARRPRHMRRARALLEMRGVGIAQRQLAVEMAGYERRRAARDVDVLADEVA